jgi:hypothetical protein
LIETDAVHHDNSWCKAHFSAEELADDGHGLGASRALAAEFVALDLMSYLSANDALEYLCYELPPLEPHDESEEEATESTGLLEGGTQTRRSCSNEMVCVSIGTFAGLNTLEIAILADAKKFLSHRPVSLTDIHYIGQDQELTRANAGTTYD